MSWKSKHISHAIDQLSANLSRTARVDEWAKLMGYNCPQKFGLKFLRQFKVRPSKVLIYLRLLSIIKSLRSTDGISNFEIADRHSLPDEKALNNFTKYHLGFPPSRLKSMSEKELDIHIKEFEIKSGIKI